MSERQLIGAEYVLDGEVDILQARRTAIKLAERPKIAVALPVGSKPVTSILPLDGKLYDVSDGFRAPGLVPIEFMLAHMNWVPPLNVSMAYMVKKNMLSAHARQVMTKEAIRLNAEYIFYVDDDTIIPALGLYTLYNFMERNPHAGAISGVYTTREDPNEPLIYGEHGEGCSWDFEMGPGAKPEPIFGAGAGCMLARVSSIVDTIEKMQKENGGDEVPIWADEKDIPAVADPSKQKVMWGHDVRFCRMLNMHGHPVYVHGQVLCGHYDVRQSKTFVMPEDAPGFQKTKDRLGNINTPQYWDQIYSQEGAVSWRKYPEMFQAVADAVGRSKRVVELGCGTGILGSKLVVQNACAWVGYDHSDVAVNMAKTRFLDARILDIKNLTHDDSVLVEADVVVVTELIEHLNRDDAIALLSTLHNSLLNKIVFTTPDNHFGPEDEKEHTALFNEEHVLGLILEALGPVNEWDIEIRPADEKHLICVMER